MSSPDENVDINCTAQGPPSKGVPVDKVFNNLKPQPNNNNKESLIDNGMKIWLWAVIKILPET